jgi:CRP-like cAMP-binding protein
MDKAFGKFKQFVAPFGFNETDYATLAQFCEFVTFPKGAEIMKAGDKQNYIYYISKGIIRNFVLSNDGHVRTYGFRMENMLVTGYSIHNFKDEHRAVVNIECLEDCEMIKIPFSALKFMEGNSKDAHKVARYIAEAHIMDLVEFIIDNDTKTLLERYNNLEASFPNIHQRLPQHIIASYLRVTPVHLSNVKKNRKLV